MLKSSYFDQSRGLSEALTAKVQSEQKDFETVVVAHCKEGVKTSNLDTFKILVLALLIIIN